MRAETASAPDPALGTPDPMQESTVKPAVGMVTGPHPDQNKRLSCRGGTLGQWVSMVPGQFPSIPLLTLAEWSVRFSRVHTLREF